MSNKVILMINFFISARLARLSCSVDVVGPSESAPSTPNRRRNHKILIRRINSESDGLDCPHSAPPNMDSQRHVRFGFLEEIEFNENDEYIDNEPYTPTKKVVSIHPCIKLPNRSCALEATTPPFKKNAMLKFVTFCSSKN